MTFEDAEKATQFLVDTAYPYGDARARVARSEAMLRHIKALAMKASDEKSAAAQEREAYASVQYLAAIDEVFEAVKAEARLKAAREAAVIKVEVWRSVNARQRGA